VVVVVTTEPVETAEGGKGLPPTPEILPSSKDRTLAVQPKNARLSKALAAPFDVIRSTTLS
jgi:hypothetical protein